MKIVFMGTPEFSVPCLKMLNENGYEIVGVVTQTDKPKGRGKKITMPPVKEYAISNNIEVVQPPSVRKQEFVDWLESKKPDLLITVAYGKILPKSVLDIPKYGCINVHASLLPKYRGAAPIQWAIINGEEKTGITTMMTDVGMDTGDILLMDEVTITESMTGGELHNILMELGPKTLKKTLEKLENGTLIRTKQNDEDATTITTISKELGLIKWNDNSAKIVNLIRAFDPWPGAYTHYKNNRIRIWKAEKVKDNIQSSVTNYGEIIDVSKEGIIVKTSDGFLKITELQADSSKRMSAESFICGHKILVGDKFEQ